MIVNFEKHSEIEYLTIAGLVLAAGLSQRMGTPKLVLPWEETTVIGKVVQTLHTAGLRTIIVVTGGWKNEVETALNPFRKQDQVQMVHNREFATGDMLTSIQCGIKHMPAHIRAALIALGDQPQIEVQTVMKLLRVYQDEKPALVVPSYQNRRGHPWIVDQEVWFEIIKLEAGQTMRDLFHGLKHQIRYVLVRSPSVCQDLDTPEDYRRYRPG